MVNPTATFEFASAAQIIFGAGTITRLPALIKDWGPRVLLVTGARTERAHAVLLALEKAGRIVETFSVAEEPSIQIVDNGVRFAREFQADCVVGMGGGSVLDAAKAIAGLSPNHAPILDFLEIVGAGKPLTQPALPWIAIPTTAGTGAEVTRNAVISVPEKELKVSLRSPLLLARVALVDPALTLSLPSEVTASTGLDALTQLIEGYVSAKSNLLSDALCATAIPRLSQALPHAFDHPDNLSARTDVSFGSLCSGLVLANAGLGLVHGFAAPLGGKFHAPHGMLCAALLGPVMRVNHQALRHSGDPRGVLEKYREIATWLTGQPNATSSNGIDWINQLVSRLRIPRLASWGITPKDGEDIVKSALQASSTKGNPIALDAGQALDALTEAF